VCVCLCVKERETEQIIKFLAAYKYYYVSEHSIFIV
jgi:hypothetical protein